MADESPWLLVGLGNPGTRYADNRHNVGFMVLDALVADLDPHSPDPWRDKWNARVAGVRVGSGRAVALKPMEFMNRSGKAVAAAAKFHGVAPERVLVVHDELDFEFGRTAIKKGGGHGGHNGLRDIVQWLGSNAFNRIRVGIGRPPHGDVSNWVLSNFDDSDRAELPDVVRNAAKAAVAVVREGVGAAMNSFNQSQPSASN